MKLQSALRNSLFLQSCRIAKSNPAKIGMMVLFDAMFLVSFFTVQKLSNYLGAGILPYITFSPILFLFLLSAIYYIILLFLYSFFKCNIIDFIKSIFTKTQFTLKTFWDFYLLNLIIALIFFIIMLGISYILANLKPNYAPYMFLIFAVPYLLFLYIVVNISQPLIYNGNSVKESLKKGFKITFTEMKSYREAVFVIVSALIILWLLFLGFGYFVRLFTSGNYLGYLSAYATYTEIVKWLVSIIAYIIILINRIVFYTVAKEGA